MAGREMSTRKFVFEGFGINIQTTYNFEPAQGAPQRLYAPHPSSSSCRGSHDNYGDNDLDNIDYCVGEDDHEEEEAKAPPPKDEEIDPLNAFMEGLHEDLLKAPPPSVKPKENLDRYKDDDPMYKDDEEDDPMESFLRAKKDVGLTLASDALQAGYDSDKGVYEAAKPMDAGVPVYYSDDKKKIEPIAPLDHTCIDYEPFNMNFYEESPSISGMSDLDVAEYRKSLAIRVSGFDVPRPIKTFKDAGFSPQLMSAIKKQGYGKPTAIQCQSLPIVLSGMDVIGIAKTGSGKTAAFVLPMIVHIMDQPELEKEEGPIGVICAPTRELAQRIYLETKKFAKSQGIRVAAVYGGMSKLDQFKELKAGCEIVIATPGRLIDMLKMKALTMSRATYLVLDEADRMFDLGFEPQIRSIVGQIRPDRQTLLFSATMPRKIEKLARKILTHPVRVTVGEVGMANEDITQVAHVLPPDADKMHWLLQKLPGMIDDGDVLVFASKEATVDELETQLVHNGFKVAALHGDKDQASRMETLQKFKSGTCHVLVATDVAVRGLDIKSIKSVVNFDIVRDMDMHAHRIGRTGRAGDQDGTACTLITQKQARFAIALVNSLIAAGQIVPTELMDLAMKGTSALGFFYCDGIMVATDSRSSNEGVKAKDRGGDWRREVLNGRYKSFRMTPNVVGLIVGKSQPCRDMLHITKKWMQESKTNEVSAVYEHIEEYMKDYLLRGEKAEFSTIIAGYDPKKMFQACKFEIVEEEVKKHPILSFGALGSGAKNVEEYMAESFVPNLSRDEAFELACKAIFHSSFRDRFTDGNIRVQEVKATGVSHVQTIECLHAYAKYYDQFDEDRILFLMYHDRSGVRGTIALKKRILELCGSVMQASHCVDHRKSVESGFYFHRIVFGSKEDAEKAYAALNARLTPEGSIIGENFEREINVNNLLYLLTKASLRLLNLIIKYSVQDVDAMKRKTPEK